LAVVILALMLAGSVGLHVLGAMGDWLGPSTPGSHLMEFKLDDVHSRNKIAVVPVTGVIMGGGEPVSHSLVRTIEQQLEFAAQDDAVAAVILKVDSPGGAVLASDDIYQLITNFQNRHNKPVVASLGSVAASGGYYVSAPCRWIVASELTITGSIGVIMQTYNFRGLMNKVGVRPLTYKSGKFKDMLGMSKELDNLTREEKAEWEEEQVLMKRMIDETYGRFRSVVAEGRRAANAANAAAGDPGRKLSPRWTEFADGRILSGREAHELGLVDELGNWETAVRRAKQLADIKDASLVTYREPFNLGGLLGILGGQESRTVKVDLGVEIPQLKSGLYFLAPALLP
jgi:protease-4